MKVLITGGSGSGKSIFAEKISVSLKKDKLYYFATMKIQDKECYQRVQKHRLQRQGKGFITVEVPENLYEYSQTVKPEQTVLLECMSNLLANEQFENKEINPVDKIIKGVDFLCEKMNSVIIVTNEVFEDGVYEKGDVRDYLLNLGQINCRIAEKADIVIEVSCGNPFIYKGEELFNEIFN